MHVEVEAFSLPIYGTGEHCHGRAVTWPFELQKSSPIFRNVLRGLLLRVCVRIFF